MNVVPEVEARLLTSQVLRMAVDEVVEHLGVVLGVEVRAPRTVPQVLEENVALIERVCRAHTGHVEGALPTDGGWKGACFTPDDRPLFLVEEDLGDGVHLATDILDLETSWTPPSQDLGVGI